MTHMGAGGSIQRRGEERSRYSWRRNSPENSRVEGRETIARCRLVLRVRPLGVPTVTQPITLVRYTCALSSVCSGARAQVRYHDSTKKEKSKSHCTRQLKYPMNGERLRAHIIENVWEMGLSNYRKLTSIPPRYWRQLVFLGKIQGAGEIIKLYKANAIKTHFLEKGTSRQKIEGEGENTRGMKILASSRYPISLPRRHRQRRW